MCLYICLHSGQELPLNSQIHRPTKNQDSQFSIDQDVVEKYEIALA